MRQRQPDIPWGEIVGMRNRLVHAYFNVDIGLVWRTVQEDLPPLIAQLERIVPPDPVRIEESRVCNVGGPFVYRPAREALFGLTRAGIIIR